MIRISVGLLALICTATAYGQFSTVYQFTGGADGSSPQSLKLDATGMLYGVTAQGGNSSCLSGCGVVFQIDPTTGAETVLHAFKLVNGNFPESSVLKDSAGNLYSTTLYGGSGRGGVFFKLRPDGDYTVRYAFSSTGGYGPLGNIVGDPQGNIYGVTTKGGGHGFGSVYCVSPSGAYTDLHDFSGYPSDAADLRSGLYRTARGALIGVSFEGGGFNDGVLFTIAPDGTETLLHTFQGGSGRNPDGEVTADSSGNLYGTTYNGGGSDVGVVYKYTPGGQYSVLYSFSSPALYNPTGQLYLDPATGALYGTAELGGSGAEKCGFECGSVFKIDPATLTETTLYTFTGNADGSFPSNGIVGRPTPDGTQLELYGLAFGSAGSVFKLVVPR